MKKPDFSLFLFLVLITVSSLAGGYWGGELARLKLESLRAPEPEQVVNERVVVLQPIVLERTIIKSPSYPVQLTIEGSCLQSDVSDQSDMSDQSDVSGKIDREQAKKPELPAPPTPEPATPPSHKRQDPPGYDVPGVSIPGISGETAPPSSSLYELRKTMGLGLRGAVNQGVGAPEYSAAAYGYWEFLRLSDVYFTGYGEIDNDRDKKVQLDMQWRHR